MTSEHVYLLMIISLFSVAPVHPPTPEAGLDLPDTPEFDQSFVTNTNDSGPGSLRQAITDARFGEQILFHEDVHGVIRLQSQLVIDKEISIAGPGDERVTLSGGEACRIFCIGAHGTVTISDLTLAKGSAKGLNGCGGGIYSAQFACLVVERCTFTGNTAGAFGDIREMGTSYGGAIFSDGGRVKIANCVFEGNSALGRSAFGGAIFGHSVEITDSKLSVNSDAIGGAVFAASEVRMTNSFVCGNIARLAGGGVDCGGTTVISNSAFSANLTAERIGGAFHISNATLDAHQDSI